MGILVTNKSSITVVIIEVTTITKRDSKVGALIITTIVITTKIIKEEIAEIIGRITETEDTETRTDIKITNDLASIGWIEANVKKKTGVCTHILVGRQTPVTPSMCCLATVK